LGGFIQSRSDCKPSLVQWSFPTAVNLQQKESVMFLDFYFTAALPLLMIGGLVAAEKLAKRMGY
jgi:hypothetical protein